MPSWRWSPEVKRKLRTRSSRSPPALHPLGRPAPVRVSSDADGLPLAIVGGEGCGPGMVLQVRERWRIDDEWWRTPISRLYYQVVMEGGRNLTLYHDLEEGGWYRQQ